MYVSYQQLSYAPSLLLYSGNWHVTLADIHRANRLSARSSSPRRTIPWTLPPYLWTQDGAGTDLWDQWFRWSGHRSSWCADRSGADSGQVHSVGSLSEEQPAPGSWDGTRTPRVGRLKCERVSAGGCTRGRLGVGPARRRLLPAPMDDRTL